MTHLSRTTESSRVSALYMALGQSLNNDSPGKSIQIMDALRKLIQDSPEAEGASSSNNLGQLPMITFDRQGKILQKNPQANECFQNSNHLKNIISTPDYFLEMTRSSLLVEQKEHLLWKVDLQTGSNAAARAEVLVTPEIDCYQARVQFVPVKTKQEKRYLLNDAFVVHYSSDWLILSSEGTQRIIGFKSADLLEKNFLEFIHTDDLPSLKQAMQEHQDIRFLCRLLTKDDGFTWFKIHMFKLEDETYRCIVKRSKFQEKKKVEIQSVGIENAPSQGDNRSTEEMMPSAVEALPPKNDMPAAVSPSEFSQIDLPKLSILLVEDGQLNQITMTKILRDLNQNVVKVAPNGKIALDYLLQASVLPDLIVSDKDMPVMGGIKFIENLRQDLRLSHLYCILWTANAYSMRADESEACEALQVATILDKGASKSQIKGVLIDFVQSQNYSSVPRKRTFENTK